MKKIYTLITTVVIVASTNAQSVKGGLSSFNSNVKRSNLPIQIKQMSPNRANGDTLMYMPLPGAFVNSTDSAGFQIVTEDIDALPTNNAGYATSFGMYYSTDSSLDGNGGNMSSNWYHTWETPAPLGTDTAFFFNATSWFNPAGQANNWLSFGPLTIPANGASLIWYERFNPWGIDGYQVYVSNTPSTVLTFADFNDPAIFTKLDAHPSPTAATDSIWRKMEIAIPTSYSGQVVSIGFNHNANDIDVFHLDEISVVEGPLGITENEFVNGVKLEQNIPNPFSNNTEIRYQLEKSATVALSVYDVTGKKVLAVNSGEQTTGSHSLNINSANLSEGVYYYSLTVGTSVTACKKMVVIK